MVRPLFPIFSNSSHVFQQIKNRSTNFVQNTLRNNYTKFHLNPFSSFRGEDFFLKPKTDNDDSSPGHWPGELKSVNAWRTFVALLIRNLLKDTIKMAREIKVSKIRVWQFYIPIYTVRNGPWIQRKNPWNHTRKRSFKY